MNDEEQNSSPRAPAYRPFGLDGAPEDGPSAGEATGAQGYQPFAHDAGEDAPAYTTGAPAAAKRGRFRSLGMPADSALPGWLTHVPDFARPYVALSRLDRPVGIWLLFLPCLMGIAFTRIPDGFQFLDLGWAILFGVGAVAMRGAGCTWNDITDREIDAKVERTAARPLPSGKVSVLRAGLWLGVQVLVGLLVWLILPMDAKIVAALAIPLVAAYPFMKRLTWWPQAWLGATLNWGVLVAAATIGGVSLSTVILWLGLAAWTIAYDTIYALQDVEDDELIGVKSTARLFGEHAIIAAFCFHLLAGAIIALAAWAMGAGRLGSVTALAFLAHATWQVVWLSGSLKRQALKVFKSNVWAGWILVAGFSVAAIFA
jgi:4-hydroxybenzoate polyprenyltransferase